MAFKKKISPGGTATPATTAQAKVVNARKNMPMPKKNRGK